MTGPVDIAHRIAMDDIEHWMSRALAAEERARKAEEEVARLKSKHFEEMHAQYQVFNEVRDIALADYKRAEAAEAKLAEAREALRPLAEDVEMWPLDGTSLLGAKADSLVDITVRVSDIHRAAALLAETTEGGDADA